MKGKNKRKYTKNKAVFFFFEINKIHKYPSARLRSEKRNKTTLT